jgi:nitroimidazol reductase NimA-like FMN-containing flavoprotein (pyridoxamine 5'-phosphate oxidase superfamily)
MGSASGLGLEEAMSAQRYGRRVALSVPEVHALLHSAALCRVGTCAQGTPHVTPMWFLWDGAAIWLYSIVKSKRWRDIASNPSLSIVVDSGEIFQSYRGIEVKGRARVVGDVPRMNRPNPDLAEVERAFARKYNGIDELVIDGRHAWLQVRPRSAISWDFGTLSAMRSGVNN